MTLTFKAAKQTLWLMMLHHYTKFGNKCSAVQRVSSKQRFSEILSLCCDLDCSNPIFLLDTPAYDAVLSNQVKIVNLNI